MKGCQPRARSQTTPFLLHCLCLFQGGTGKKNDGTQEAVTPAPQATRQEMKAAIQTLNGEIRGFEKAFRISRQRKRTQQKRAQVFKQSTLIFSNELHVLNGAPGFFFFFCLFSGSSRDARQLWNKIRLEQINMTFFFTFADHAHK